jgi:hypothetical protein
MCRLTQFRKFSSHAGRNKYRTLAGRKFQRKPIRAYWEEVAWDLGVGKDTVRKWAYELKATPFKL